VSEPRIEVEATSGHGVNRPGDRSYLLIVHIVHLIARQQLQLLAVEDKEASHTSISSTRQLEAASCKAGTYKHTTIGASIKRHPQALKSLLPRRILQT
jgi:hypothetical protein